MKNIILLFISVLFVQISAAQVRVGLKAGLSTTDIAPEQLRISNLEDIQSLKLSVADANYGIHFGLFLQAKMGKFFLQPEVLFNSNSIDFAIDDNSDAASDILNEKYQYLDIPIMMGLKLGPLRIQGGPVGHLFLNSKSELFDIDNYDQKFEKLTYGWQAGLGLDIWKFLIDVKYEGDFSKFGDHFIFGGQSYAFEERAGRFVFSLGYAF